MRFRSSGRAVYVFNCWAVSPSPGTCFLTPTLPEKRGGGDMCFYTQGWSYQSTHSRHRVLQSEAVTHSLSHNTHRESYTSHCWAFLIWEHDLTAQELSSLSHMKADRSSTSGIPFLSRAPSWLHCVHSCVTPPPSDFRIFLPPQGREPPYLFWSLHILSSPPQTSSRLLCRLSGSGFTV